VEVPLAAFGEALEAGGTGVSIALDLGEGDYENAIWDSGALVLDAAASKVISNIAEAQEIFAQGESILQGHKEIVEEFTGVVIDDTTEDE
jgi:hypothetical protein